MHVGNTPESPLLEANDLKEHADEVSHQLVSRLTLWTNIDKQVLYSITAKFQRKRAAIVCTSE